MASADPLAHNPLSGVHCDVGLSNDVFIFLPGRQVKGMGLVFGRPFPSLHLLVNGIHLRMLINLSDLEVAASTIDDLDVVHNLPIHDLAVGRFDKPEFVDFGIAAQGGDQANIGPFWGLNGADATIVGGVNIPHFKPGSLSTHSPRAQC